MNCEDKLSDCRKQNEQLHQDMDLDFSRCRKVWVPDDSIVEEIEVCLGCGKPTKERDCGCPAGTGLVKREVGGFWSDVRPHVKVGVKTIIDNPYLLLADDMGGMKTAQAIIAAQFLHEMDVINRVIVVAPSSIRSTVWFDEDIGQLREHFWLDKRHLVSEYHTKVRQWRSGPETAKELRWIVTNYEYIRGENLIKLLNYCGPKTLLVLDESNAVRGWDSVQTEACMALRWRANKRGRPILGSPRCGRILEMNGTPLADSPMDLFSQGNLLHPSILECRFITHFKARYAVETPVLASGGHEIRRHGRVVKSVQSWTNLEDLQRRFAPYVLRREAKDLGIDFALPPVALEVRLTKDTWTAYKQMRDHMVIWLKSGVATSRTAAVKSLRLSQITSGFVGGIEDWDKQGTLLDYHDDEPASIGGQGTEFIPQDRVREIGREKLDFALEWHADLLRRYPDLKLLTWCRFVPELRRYLQTIKKTYTHPIGVVCGKPIFESNKDHERETALRLLHPKTAPAGPVTVGATQGTGALGLNFTACRTVLDMSYDFSPWKKKQGDARVNRPGQTGPVSFFFLIAVGPQGQKTIDHHVFMTRLGKMNINNLTMQAWVRMLEEE